MTALKPDIPYFKDGIPEEIFVSLQPTNDDGSNLLALRTSGELHQVFAIQPSDTLQKAPEGFERISAIQRDLQANQRKIFVEEPSN